MGHHGIDRNRCRVGRISSNWAPCFEPVVGHDHAETHRVRPQLRFCPLGRLSTRAARRARLLAAPRSRRGWGCLRTMAATSGRGPATNRSNGQLRLSHAGMCDGPQQVVVLAVGEERSRSMIACPAAFNPSEILSLRDLILLYWQLHAGPSCARGRASPCGPQYPRAKPNPFQHEAARRLTCLTRAHSLIIGGISLLGF